MKILLVSFLSLFLAFTGIAQNRPSTNNSSSQSNTQSRKYTETDAWNDISKGECSNPGLLLLQKRITSGKLFEAWKKCTPPATRGKTSDALEFNPKTDDLSPLPKLIQPIGNNNVAYGNTAFKQGDFQNALEYFRTYLMDNIRIFQNINYEDWLENYLDKIKYCFDRLDEEDEDE